jgi:endonuclease YncB( thermonuclease family)
MIFLRTTNMSRKEKDKIRYAMSRKRRRAILLIIIGLIVPLAVILDRHAGRPLRHYIRRTAVSGDDAQKYHSKFFDVVKVIDGDTLDLAVADGKYPATRVRLLGVDTPETKHPKMGQMYYGPEACNFTEKLTADQKVMVIIDTLSQSRDRYGRLLCYIQTRSGQILNEQLIIQGFGYADLRFEHGRYDEYIQMMETAVKKRAGLWENVKFDQLPSWLQREYPDILTLSSAPSRFKGN